jgi:alpha-tubulin suppressor-like RCC1 family protein
MQSGTVYTWGKGEHERPKFNDYLEYSSPFVILEQKQIIHLAFGRSHVMALEQDGRVFAWGEGQHGCLGFGDTKRRPVPQQLTFFDTNKRRVIDIACGQKFTVVVALVAAGQVEESEENKTFDYTNFQIQAQDIKSPRES